MKVQTLSQQKKDFGQIQTAIVWLLQQTGHKKYVLSIECKNMQQKYVFRKYIRWCDKPMYIYKRT